MMALLPAMAWAEVGDEFTADGLKYKVTSESPKIVELIGYDGEQPTGALAIPATVNSYTVTSIGAYAFNFCTGLTTVSIPESVTSIGEYAFNSCKVLTSIMVNEGNESYSSKEGVLFDKAGTTLIIYPAGKAEAYSVPKGVTSIGEKAFHNCTGLTSASIPESVMSIGKEAFRGCSGLTSIEIPNSVTSIGDWVFIDCTSLTSIVISNSVTSIGDAPFNGCFALTSIVVTNGNAVYDSRENCNAIIRTKDNTLIAGCKNTTIPNSVTSIGRNAFSGFRDLHTITIPEGVTSIGDYAFYGTMLSGIELPTTVTNIGDYAFASTGLAGILIPANVTSIGICAFALNNGLNVVMFADGSQLTTIGEGAFSGCDLWNFSIPASVTSIGDYAFQGNRNMTSINIPDGVTKIGVKTFSQCSGLTKINIPKGVTSIGEEAFNGCKGLTSFIIPAAVTFIGKMAFGACSNIAHVYCYADIEALTWEPHSGLSFMRNRATQCHVRGNPEAWQSKYTNVYVTFVGGLPEIIDTPTTVNLSETAESGQATTTESGVTTSLGEEDVVDTADGSVTIVSSMTNDAVKELIDTTQPGSSYFNETFKGFYFLLAAGKGKVEFDIETSGGYSLGVMKGTELVGIYTQTTKGTVTIPYDIAEDTWFFAYPVVNTPAAANRAASDGALKVYGLRIIPEESGTPDGIDNLTTNNSKGKGVYNLAGQRIGGMAKGLNIVDGKKVMVK